MKNSGRKIKILVGLLLLVLLASSCKAKKRKVTCYYFMVDNGSPKKELHETRRA